MPRGMYFFNPVPPPEVPVYHDYYGMPYTDYGTDDMFFDDVGYVSGQDTVENVGRWGRWYGYPIYTGGGITMSAAGYEGALKSWAVQPPYDIRVTIDGIVFPFPANYGWVLVTMRTDQAYQYCRVRYGATYPYNIYLEGRVRSYGSSYTANNGILSELPTGSVTFRFINNGDASGSTHFWNYNTSNWQQLHSRSTNHPIDPSVLSILCYRSDSNPNLTASIEQVTVQSAAGYYPTTFRLGNNTYRKVRGRFQSDAIDLTGSETNGIQMSTIAGEKGSNPYHMYISDPPPEELDADTAWTVESKWQAENWSDSRLQAFFEIGHWVGHRAYDLNWTDAVYYQNDVIGNYHFGRDQRSAARMEWNGTDNRVYWKRWNNSGVYDAGGNVAHADGLRGVFKCVNDGAGTFRFYFGLDSADTLIYTWTPTNWSTAGYPNGKMYIGLGYTDGYANCDMRWYYCTITLD